MADALGSLYEASYAFKIGKPLEGLREVNKPLHYLDCIDYRHI